MKKSTILIGAVIVILGVSILLFINTNKKLDYSIEPGIIKNTSESSTETSELETNLAIGGNTDDLVVIPPMEMKQETNSISNETSNAETNITETLLETLASSAEIEQSYIISDDNPVTEPAKEYLKQQQDEMAELESQMAENVAINTRRDAIEMYRETAKANVKRLISEGHAEFNGITDEIIDNYSEDELMELVWQITQIN